MKVEWKGIIPEEARKWLSFSIQIGKDYDYNPSQRPYEIIVSSDDNDGINPDEIYFDVETNNTANERTTNVIFTQKKGKTLKYLVKQNVGHVKVFDKQETESNGEITDASITIKPKTVNCKYDDTSTAFNATYTYKEVSYVYRYYYYADTKEKIKELFKKVISDTKTIDNVSKFTWKSDNGTIQNGLLKFDKNTDRNNVKTYNVTVSYSGISDTATVTQGVDDSFIEYIVRTNIKDATAVFSDNGTTLTSMKLTNSSDSSLNPYIAKFNTHESNTLSVTINGDKNEITVYNLNVSPKNWDGNLNDTIDVTVNSTYRKEFDDFSNNTKLYPTKVYDITINIPHVVQNGDTEYTADLPNGIKDISAKHDFTKLQIDKNILKKGGDIQYYVKKSPKHKDSIKLIYSSDDLIKENNVLTLVCDYGLLGKTLDDLTKVKVYRNDMGFNYTMIDNIFVATTSSSYMTQDNFKVVKLNPNDSNYFENGSNFTFLKVKEHPELIVKGNKVIMFIKLNTTTIPNVMEYYNHDITAARIPTPYTSLDNACFYSNWNLRTIFIGESVNTLASDCLAGFTKIEKIYIGSKQAPFLDKADETGYTFRATMEYGKAEAKNCVIYGVKGSYDSYHVDSNDPWKWDGCIKAPTTANIEVDSATHQEIDDNIKTWRIDTDTYEVKNELETFKNEVINKVTGSSLV